ncbi:MAG: hypothetical protein BWK80_44410 [Desulfobacteraceae bacterium IS3]|nr:MAG: hypothetical protein BWK80_44410 [Desulfobacteraceae bacterium IS3]
MMKSCITVGTLADYIEGRLSDDEKDQVEEHLSRCDECLEEFVFAQALLNDSELMETEYGPEPADRVMTVFQEVRGLVKQKISDWLTELPVPIWLGQYEAVRSTAVPSSAYMLIKKNINEFQTELFISQEENDKARLCIRVFKNNRLARNASLTLIRDGEIPFARVLNRDYVCFDRQLFGEYRLAVGHDAEAALKNTYCFEISPTGFYEKQYHNS